MRILLFFLLTVSVTVSAQKQANIWYFGVNGGLDFNSGVPVALTDGQTYECMGHAEGSSVISDSTGALLFYTNGRDIWNRTHQLMPNGIGLDGSLSATQSSLILPLPGSSQFYYVFTVDGFLCGSNLGKGLRYSIVDMCLNEGLGDVVSTSKNTPLTDYTSEKLTAVNDAAGNGYWVITRKHYSHDFYAWHLTDSGLSGPVISPVALSYIPPIMGAGTLGSLGQLKASPDGTLLASASGNDYNHMELFQFDNASGAVFNPMELPLPNPNNRPYSVSFSPDNSKVYFSMASINPIETKLVQFDLSGGSFDAVSIAATENVIWHLPNAASPFIGLQLAPNGKLYFYAGKSVINQPNLPGSACDLQLNAVSFLAGTSYVFPNFLDSFQYGNTTTSCLTSAEGPLVKPLLTAYPNPNKGTFVLQLQNMQESGVNAELRNILGQVVWQQSLTAENGNVQQQIKTTNLSKGIYLLRVSTGKGNAVQKLIIE